MYPSRSGLAAAWISAPAIHCSGDIPEALAAAPVSLCSVPVLQQLSSNSSKDAQSLVLNRRLRLPPVTASDANGRLYCAGRSSIKISVQNKKLVGTCYSELRTNSLSRIDRHGGISEPAVRGKWQAVCHL